MQKLNEKNELSAHRMGKLTVLQLMMVLGILGIALTWILQRVF